MEQKKLTKQELVDSRFAIGFAPLWDHVDGAEMALRYQDYISLQGATLVFQVRGLTGPTWKKPVTSSMVQTNGVTAIQEGRLAYFTIVYFKEVFLSLSSFILRNQNLHFWKLASLIPGFSKEETLMIGDSLTADIAGGNAVGDWYRLR